MYRQHRTELLSSMLAFLWKPCHAVADLFQAAKPFQGSVGHVSIAQGFLCIPLGTTPPELL